jgi:hypothetical protein
MQARGTTGRGSTMRKLLVLGVTLALAAVVLASTPPAAHAGGQVVATWTLTELHQGGHGGGPLFADGTAAGNFAISADNGQLVGMFVPTTWSWVVPGAELELCSDVRVIAAPAGMPPPPSPICGTFPVTGTPQRLLGPNGEFLLRVTLAN